MNRRRQLVGWTHQPDLNPPKPSMAAESVNQRSTESNTIYSRPETLLLTEQRSRSAFVITERSRRALK